ncbi:MAG: hypothetical protein QOE05_763 [Actinomycetota bacterium]|nr:hypothetical protein [Actinomycetota bacterium]
MPPDDTVPPQDAGPPGGDWEFPPVDPADDLLGWTPEPALPHAAAEDAPLRMRPAFGPGSVPAEPEPVAAAEAEPDVAAEAEPVVAAEADPVVAAEADPVEPADPVEDAAPSAAVSPEALPVSPLQVIPGDPVPADPFAGIGAPLLAAVEEPPSTGVLPVPRRSSVPGGPVSPVRALAGAAVAVAGVLLGIGALLWATDAPKGSPALQQTQAQSSLVSRSASPTASPLPSPSPEPTTAVPAPLTSPSAATTPAAAPKLALTVLNNSNVNKLAARAAAKYQAKGWPIKDTGSFRGRIPVTTVYYAPGQQASAELLQKQFPAIQRVRPRFATLPGSGLTVVLTRDYPA